MSAAHVPIHPMTRDEQGSRMDIESEQLTPLPRTIAIQPTGGQAVVSR